MADRLRTRGYAVNCQIGVELHQALCEFRDTVIATEMTNWERRRSLLRDAMVETFVSQRIDDPEDWFRKVPRFQRQATNPAERRRYLERVCDLVARLMDKRPRLEAKAVPFERKRCSGPCVYRKFDSM